MAGLDTAERYVETIVKTIVGLGRSPKTRGTTEGVEDIPQMEFVRAVRCDQAQGQCLADLGASAPRCLTLKKNCARG